MGKVSPITIFSILYLQLCFPVSCDHVNIGELQSNVDISCKHPLHSTNSIKKHIKLSEMSAELNNTHTDIFPTYS